MQYKIKAIRQNGEHYEEVREASDKLSIYGGLKQTGETIISISEVDSKKPNVFINSLKKLISRVSTNEKISFAKNLGSMLNAGLPIVRALSVMERQTKNTKLKSIFIKIQDDINKGQTLSQSLSDFPEVFSTLFISMIKSGEESGTISNSLTSVATQMEKFYQLVKRLRGAMIYPAIVITIMVIIGILLLIFLVPSLTQTFSELTLELPLSTRIVIGSSNFLKAHYLISSLILIVVVFLLYTFFKTQKGKKIVSYTTLKIPVVSTFIKESNSAKTARILSSLLTSGVDFLVAIKITEDVIQNYYYKNILREAGEVVQKGDTISSVFLREDVQKLYPPFVGEMANIGEETGKLSEMFSNIADFYEEEVNQRTKNFSTIVEPFLMVCIGLFVGLFAVSMLGPIYSLVDAL